MFHLNQNWNCARSLQTFAIPGSLFLSILSGFLFNFPVALTLVCFCSALGATLCYMLSQLVGRRIVKHFFPKRANDWAAQVERHKDELLSYMLFLRMTPFLPNWFINLVAPVIGVPLFPFAVGTFFGMHFFFVRSKIFEILSFGACAGVAPPSFLAIQAGKTLNTMTSSTDAVSWTSMLLLLLFACVTLVPVIFKKQFKRKVEWTAPDQHSDLVCILLLPFFVYLKIMRHICRRPLLVRINLWMYFSVILLLLAKFHRCASAAQTIPTPHYTIYQRTIFFFCLAIKKF